MGLIKKLLKKVKYILVYNKTKQIQYINKYTIASLNNEKKKEQ